MKTPLRTFMILTFIGAGTIVALRLWADDRPAGDKGGKSCDFPYVLTFNEVQGYPVSAKYDKAIDFKKALDGAGSKKKLYDLDFYEQAGQLPHRILPEAVIPPPSPGPSPTKQLSPHITQRVSVNSKTDITAVMSLLP